jgi:hypothetical protein
MWNLVWAYKYTQYIGLPKRPPTRNDCLLFTSHTYWPRWWHSNSLSIYTLYYQIFHVYGWGHITINYTYIGSGKHVGNPHKVCGWRLFYSFLIPSVCHCQCAHFSKRSSSRQPYVFMSFNIQVIIMFLCWFSYLIPHAVIGGVSTISLMHPRFHILIQRSKNHCKWWANMLFSLN